MNKFKIMKQLFTLLLIISTTLVFGQNLTTVYVDMSKYSGSFDKVQIQVEQEGWGLRDVTQDTTNPDIWYATIVSYGDANTPAKVQYKWAVVVGGVPTVEDIGANCYGGKVDNDFVWDYRQLPVADTGGEDAFHTSWWDFFNRVIVTDGATRQSANVFYFGTMRSNSVATTTITVNATSGSNYYINYDKGEGAWDDYADILAVDNGDDTHTATVRASAAFKYYWATGTGNQFSTGAATAEFADMGATCGGNRVHTAGSTGSDTYAVCPATASVTDIASSFSIYPNPVQNTLNVSATATVDSVSIFDLTGRQVLRATPNAAAFSLDVANLNKGLYLVSLKAGDQEMTTKLVK